MKTNPAARGDQSAQLPTQATFANQQHSQPDATPSANVPQKEQSELTPQKEQSEQTFSASASTRPLTTGVGRLVVRSDEAVTSNDGTTGELGCPSGEQVCESTRNNRQTMGRETRHECYNAATHVCTQRDATTKTNKLLCPKNAPLLCGSQCYNPATYICSVTEVLCPTKHPNLCGWACYTNTTHRCVDDQLLPLDVRSHSMESMFTGLEVNVDVSACDHVCNTTNPLDEERHFPRCYDPATHVCAERAKVKVNEGSYFLCPHNKPLACGDNCFSQDQYSCHVRSVLCPMAAPKVCGLDCYDPALYQCSKGRLFSFASMSPEQMYGRDLPQPMAQD